MKKMTDHNSPEAKAFFDACAERCLWKIKKALREASDAQKHTLLDQDGTFKPSPGWELKFKPLHVAAYHGDEKVVKLLVDEGANLDALDKNGLTALHTAAKYSRSGRFEVVKLLVDRGANLEAQDEDGATALHTAAKLDDCVEVFKLLVDGGANLEAQDEDGATALHHAAYKDRREVVKLLVDGGANLDAQGNDGQTALHMATSVETVKLLVDGGANLEAQGEDGQTALHMHAYWGHGEIVNLLVDKGANLEAQGNGGQTALHHAAERDRVEVVKLLVNNGANLEAQDNDGQTALHTAAGEAYGEVVKLLVDKGANHDVQNNDGETALYLAITRLQTDGVTKCIDSLLQKHAEKSRQTANGIQEGLIYSSVNRACEDAERLALFKSNLLANISHEQSNDSMNVLRLFAVLIDSKRAKSFKFSDDEISKIGKVLAGSLAEIVNFGLFNTPLATLAVLAGALGNRARLRVQVKDDLLALRSKAIQLSFAALSIPEMDEKDTALEALGYLNPIHRNTGAFLTMGNLPEEEGAAGLKNGAPFVSLIAHKVTELIAVPQLQSSINAVFYKERGIILPNDDVFTASMMSKEEQDTTAVFIQSEELSIRAKDIALPDCSGKPLYFFIKALRNLEWKAQDWRMLPRYFFLSQFIFHCCYFTLTVLAFWHSEKVSWCTGVLGLMTLGYGVEEICQLLSENGFERYINDPWNVIDAAFLFSFLLWYATEIDVWLAVNLFLVPFRLLHYLSIFQSAGVLVAVLIRMITATCKFLVFYAVILFGFSAMMLALFGNKDIDGFESFSSSTLTLFDASLGNYDFSIFWIEDQGYTWGGVASLVIFLLLSAVMALNLLIAVLSEEYSRLADRAYSEWCYMYAQIVQENTVLAESSFGILKLPPPLSLISMFSQRMALLSNHLRKKSKSITIGHETSASSTISSDNDGGLASMETDNPVTEHVMPGQPDGSPDDAAEQIQQATGGITATTNRQSWALGLSAQVLHFAATIMVASVDAMVHILVGLPWALFAMYSLSFKLLLGQAEVPLYVLSLLAFDCWWEMKYWSRNYDFQFTWKLKYGNGFLKAGIKSQVLILTGCFLWLTIGVPFLSICAYIWWIPVASIKGWGISAKNSGTKDELEKRAVLLEKVRKAITSCTLTDDGNEFAQVLGDVNYVKAKMAKAVEVETQVGKLEAQGGKLEAQVGELKAMMARLLEAQVETQVGKLEAQGGKLEAQVCELKAMMARLLEAQGLATPTPAMEESVTKEEGDRTGGLASSAAPAGVGETKSS